MKGLGRVAAIAVACWAAAEAGLAGGEWIPSYAKGLELARDRKCLLLVDFSAEWCGACAKMDREVYANEQVAAALQGVVCVKVDVDHDTRTAEAFGIGSLPRTLVITSDGHIAGDGIGYVPPGEFIAFLTEARTMAAKPEGLALAPGLGALQEVDTARTTTVSLAQAAEFSPGFLEALGHPELPVRAEARRRVQEGGGSYVPHLVHALGHAALSVRIEAWQCLREIARPQTVFDPWASAAQRAKAQQAVAAELAGPRKTEK